MLALLVVLAVGYKNTTDFWAKQLNDPKIHFQAFAGIFILIQAINKLIGFTQKERVACTIVYSEPWAMML